MAPIGFQSYFPPGGTNLLSLPGWNLENNGLECLECSVFWDNGDNGVVSTFYL